MPKLIVIDGNAILHRAYHSMPPFKNSRGEVTNAIYGFLRMLFDLLKKEKPEYITVAWDRAAPTFRHEAYSEYKATRSAPPDDLYPQLPRLKQVLECLNLVSFELDGFEADDLIGTLTKQAENLENLRTIILTGDRDALQLVSAKTEVMTPLSGISKVQMYTPAQVELTYGVTPEQIIHYKALCGDSSDNIPGVPGIGPKQASTLLQKYGTFEKIYENLSELSPSQQQKFQSGKELGEMSKKLVTIDRDAPISLILEKLAPQPDFAKTSQIFAELEFKTMGRHLEEVMKIFSGTDKVPSLGVVPGCFGLPAPDQEIPRVEQQSLF